MPRKTRKRFGSSTLTLDNIDKAVPPEIFRRGQALHTEGNVTSAKINDRLITARIMDGTRLYRTHIKIDDINDGFCTCGTKSKGLCAHAVAALLYVRDNKKAMLAAKDGGNHYNELIPLVPLKDLQRFVESEIKKDSGVERRFLSRFGGLDNTSHVDYREQVDIMFGDADYMVSCANPLSFADFFRAAKSRERQGQTAEAIRIYLEVSEAIRSNYYKVDDSYGHYSDAFDKAVTEMAACIARQKTGNFEKRPHISYLHRQFLANDHDLHESTYWQALTDACTDIRDLEYLKGLNEQALPDEPIVRRAKNYYHIQERILLQAEILEKLGETVAADKLLEKHCRGSIEVCGTYVEALVRHGDPAKARRILHMAQDIFPEHEFGYIRHLADDIAE